MYFERKPSLNPDVAKFPCTPKIQLLDNVRKSAVSSSMGKNDFKLIRYCTHTSFRLDYIYYMMRATHNIHFNLERKSMYKLYPLYRTRLMIYTLVTDISAYVRDKSFRNPKYDGVINQYDF